MPHDMGKISHFEKSHFEKSYYENFHYEKSIMRTVIIKSLIINVKKFVKNGKFSKQGRQSTSVYIVFLLFFKRHNHHFISYKWTEDLHRRAFTFTVNARDSVCVLDLSYHGAQCTFLYLSWRKLTFHTHRLNFTVCTMKAVLRKGDCRYLFMFFGVFSLSKEYCVFFVFRKSEFVNF